MRRIPLLTLAVVFALPSGTQAQQQEMGPPRAMFVSQWQCPPNLMADISQQYDSLVRPVEQELVNEGLLFGAGMFFHSWGDQWNVNWYRLGMDNEQVFAAMDEIGNRLQERHPEAPNMFESCIAHKDNIYWWGPRTEPPPTP